MHMQSTAVYTDVLSDAAVDAAAEIFAGPLASAAALACADSSKIVLIIFPPMTVASWKRGAKKPFARSDLRDDRQPRLDLLAVSSNLLR